MLDDSFWCRKLEFPKVPWIHESLSGSVVWWWSYTCTLMCVLCMLVVVRYQ